ncbi:MAG: hypothetical protein K0041_06275 [Acidithiobacillus sp.]|nr:hypothetical protein [Acidithiobacillus sp.]
MQLETLLLLQNLASKKAAHTARMVTEQQRRLQAEREKKSLFIAHAEQLGERSRSWIGTETGCPAYLMQAVPVFQEAMKNVIQIQDEALSKLQETHRQAQSARQETVTFQKQVDHLVTKHQERQRKERDEAEQRQIDDLCTRRRD